ncbi:hypothetical protein PR001_g26139 [Phytophthora rubi]|uniref:Ankyrin repeat protein n=1 Tax=Phytophthora rubi TaxID=129364 RepID=A0A6A3I0S5_9STRA|nr:hypothetical protein PR001_g26139 [Phytophthora rubi]
METAVRGGHYDAARWLQEYTPYESTDEELNQVISVAVNDGAMEFAESLKPNDYELVQYVNERAKPETIEWLVEKGEVKKYQDLGALAVVVAALHGDLDLMQRIARLRNKRRKITQWPREWKFSLGHACSRGNFAMVKWMVEHPLGPEACASLKDQEMFNDLLYDAAKAGNVELVDYLFDLGCNDVYAHALLNAVKGGHVECMKRLLERCSSCMYSDRETIEKVVVAAAENGHLEILQFFHVQEAPLMHPCASRETSPNIEPTNIWWSRAAPAFDAAAGSGRLDVLKWLHANRYHGCSTNAMDHAAGNDHLSVVQWLHSNVKASCTKRAMDDAATNGHLNVVKWLHANTDVGCTQRAMDNAARYGRLKELQWLHASPCVVTRTACLLRENLFICCSPTDLPVAGKRADNLLSDPDYLLPLTDGQRGLRETVCNRSVAEVCNGRRVGRSRCPDKEL